MSRLQGIQGLEFIWTPEIIAFFAVLGVLGQVFFILLEYGQCLSCALQLLVPEQWIMTTFPALAPRGGSCTKAQHCLCSGSNCFLPVLEGKMLVGCVGPRTQFLGSR